MQQYGNLWKNCVYVLSAIRWFAGAACWSEVQHQRPGQWQRRW